MTKIKISLNSLGIEQTAVNKLIALHNEGKCSFSLFELASFYTLYFIKNNYYYTDRVASVNFIEKENVVVLQLSQDGGKTYWCEIWEEVEKPLEGFVETIKNLC